MLALLAPPVFDVKLFKRTREFPGLGSMFAKPALCATLVIIKHSPRINIYSACKTLRQGQQPVLPNRAVLGVRQGR